MTQLIARVTILLVLSLAPSFVSASPMEALEEKVKSSKWRPDRVERTDEEWRKMLPAKEFEVLREKATEQPYSSNLVTKSEKGVYTCAACGLVLFSTEDKFDSGTGWPSFTKPTGTDTLFYKTDESMVEKRVEVLCARCGSHLGHVFPKGESKEDFRYCINGAAMQFKSENSDK